MRHIEKGSGTVTSNRGEKVAVQYDLRSDQNEISAGNLIDPHATMTGMNRFEGWFYQFASSEKAG
jgi:hypothetical protein